MTAGTSLGASAELAADLHLRAAQGLPESVAETAKAVILDGVGCLFAGLAEKPSAISREYVTAVAGHPESSVAGADQQVDAASAAFANGVAIHSLDFDAIGSPPCHGTASVLPALLALAERSNASGRDVLCAFAMGWEVECRMRMAGKLRSAFHPLSVYGPVAAAAAGAILLGLDPRGIENAIAIGASAAGGLAANGQTPVKVMHAGNASRAGVIAALQAQRGLSGAAGVFERPGGYGDAFFAEVNWTQLNAGMATHYYLDLDGVVFKPYPVQLPMLSVIDAVLDARPADFDLTDFEGLELIVSPLVASRSNPRPQRGHVGKFSPEFCAAAALLFGSVGIKTFTDELVTDSRITRVIDRTTVTERPSMKTHEVSVRLRRADGNVVEVSRAHQRGSTSEPLSREQRIAKVGDCLAYAQVADITEDLVSCVEAFETVADMSRLGELLRTKRSVSTSHSECNQPA
ncbi:MmgE/PrpD family protein [Jatrophihabitans sp. DSM 45814]